MGLSGTRCSTPIQQVHPFAGADTRVAADRNPIGPVSLIRREADDVDTLGVRRQSAQRPVFRPEGCLTAGPDRVSSSLHRVPPMRHGRTAVGRLAQWESASFTPKRSGVRNPDRPPRDSIRDGTRHHVHRGRCRLAWPTDPVRLNTAGPPRPCNTSAILPRAVTSTPVASTAPLWRGQRRCWQDRSR